MKKIYSAPSATQLELLRSELEANRIPCFIQNAFPPAAGDIPPIVAWPTLWILDDKQFETAEKLLHQQLKSQGDTSQPVWTCPVCGAIVDGNFNMCWRCEYLKN